MVLVELSVGFYEGHLLRCINPPLVTFETLLSKLEYYGVRRTANELIRSYLVERSQRVLIKDNHSFTHYSEWNKVKRGGPQGSILGPLFFLFYINVLPETIKRTSLPTLFADDINIICVQRSTEGLKGCLCKRPRRS
jgi:hypothetical protein